MQIAGIKTGDKVIAIKTPTGQDIEITNFNQLLAKVGTELKDEKTICFKIERTTEFYPCVDRNEDGKLGFGAYYNYKGKGNIQELIPAAAE